MHALVNRPDLLLGREVEASRVAELSAGARAGRGGALVLAGEAGIGKSALLEHARRAAGGFRVVRASGRSSSRSFRTPPFISSAGRSCVI